MSLKRSGQVRDVKDPSFYVKNIWDLRDLLWWEGEEPHYKRRG